MGTPNIRVFYLNFGDIFIQESAQDFAVTIANGTRGRGREEDINATISLCFVNFAVIKFTCLQSQSVHGTFQLPSHCQHVF